MIDVSLEYYNLSIRMREFVDKAINIYWVLKDKNNEYNSYKKKCISLYLAGFFMDDELKEIISQNGNISIDRLLEKIDLKKDDIKTLSGMDYKDLYDTIFKSPLKSMYASDAWYLYFIKKVTPETVEFLVYMDSSLIVIEYVSGCNYLEDYIKSIEKIVSKSIDKNIMGKGPEKNNRINQLKVNDKLFKNIDNSIFYNFDNLEKMQKFERRSMHEDLYQEKKEDKSKIDYNSEEVWQILDNIISKFIGQEKACEDLFYNIIDNQQLINDGIIDVERLIIFFDGPTGTGKTSITTEITEQLDIPMVRTTITDYSSTGYHGGNLTDLLKRLYEEAGGDLKKAEKGIIFIDEFDKIAYDKEGDLKMKEAVQHQLLDFMGGGKYSISVGQTVLDSSKVEFNTSKLTFICLGALTDLRENKTKVVRPIGFNTDFDSISADTYSITSADLVKIGLEKELVGRFNTYLHTEEYSREDLLNILTTSTISPMLGFEKWIKSKGKYLTVEDGVYEAIATIASKLKTGARSLQTVVNSIRTHFLKEVLRGDKKEIVLDTDLINNIYGDIINRKSKK